MIVLMLWVRLSAESTTKLCVLSGRPSLEPTLTNAVWPGAAMPTGLKPKTVHTHVGALDLDVPQVRDSRFYPSSLEKGLRSERALKVALAEMYVQGVSTRKVAKITEQLCGFEVTSTQVSRAAKELDDILEQWRKRPLGAFLYVYLDARYEKVRHNGSVIDVAVLVAIGVAENGKRQILGTSVALSEQEARWRDFLRCLQQHQLQGVRLFISDAHEGLKAARKAVFPCVPWQRSSIFSRMLRHTCRRRR